MKKIITRLTPTGLLPILCMFLYLSTNAQVYQHDFGTTPITSYPYTATPTIVDADILNSSWTNNIGLWTSYTGETGQGLGHGNATAGSTLTLTFDVAAGKQLDVTSFNFWRVRSATGAQNWSMTINDIAVGNGAIPIIGLSIGETNVLNPVVGLTGTVNVVITLNDAFGAPGTFTLDNFEINGTITEPCTPPTITSIAPTTGPTETVVTIIGSGFEAGAGTTSVFFNGVESSGFTVVSDTEIKVLAPPMATSGVITVTTDGCEADTPVYTFLNSNCPPTGALPEVFISELYDHTPGSYGVIELYNPTDSEIVFGGQYTLERAGDVGGAPTATLTLPGSIQANSTYIVRSYGTGVIGCPIPFDASIGQGINANDEFKLKKNGAIIDIARAPNNTGYTVIRDADATAPNSIYNNSDWSFSGNSCDDLGMHSAVITSTISTHPSSESICEAEDASFTVEVSNDTGFTYQWKTIDEFGNWANIVDNAQFSGATTNTLSITNADIDLDITQYYCEITSASCTLISNAAQLTVSPLPIAIVVETQPTCSVPIGSIEATPAVGNDLTYSLDGIIYSATNTFSNLAPGDYTIYVQSSAGCISTIPATIDPIPDAPAFATTTVTQPTCTEPNGTIEITAPLGADLEYSVNGLDFQAETTFTVAPGTYNVTVQNTEGCVSTTTNIIINDAPDDPAVATTTVTQPTCAEPNGTIEVTAPLGADLEYSINGTDFQTETAFTVASGTYNITVQNADGCTSVTADITIDPVPDAPAIATTTITQPTCTEPNGTIQITAPLGLEYSINGVDFQAGTSFTVPAGTYNVTVLNTNGCTSVTGDIIINNAPDAPAVATTTLTQPTCTEPNGTIEVTAPLGANLEYSINGIDFQTETTFTVASGTYNVTVQNADSCTSVTGDIVINPVPNAPAIATTTLTQPTCTETNGTIEITAPIGAALEYSINGTDFQTGTTFTAAAGTYNITVMNADGCTSVTGDIVIDSAPNAPAIATTTVTQPTCTEPNGTIEVTAPIADVMFYSINGVDFQLGTTFTVAPGTYNVTVQNSAGCTSVTGNIVINPVPDAPAVATTTLTQPTCTEPNGTIEITAPIGADLEYSINGTDFQAGTTFTVPAGTYNVTVRNASACISVTGNIVINPVPDGPAPATVTVTQGDCTTPSGTIEVTTPLGADLEYSINGTDFQAATTFTVPAGTYNVTVRNNDGCTSISEGIIVNPAPGTPDVASVIVTQPNCTIPEGIIEITAPLGNNLQYSINGIDFQDAPTFTVAEGVYIVTVRNEGNCISETASIVINNAPDVPEIATTTVTQPTCTTTNGVIEVTAPIGANIKYSIDGTTFQDTRFFTVTSGTYTITVRSSNGCTSVTDTIIVNDLPDTPVATTIEGCTDTTFGQNYVLEVEALNNSFDASTASYTWFNTDNEEVGSNQSTFNVSQYVLNNSINAGDYPLNFSVTITTDKGCIVSYSFEVVTTYCSIPKGISPNNDNRNDTFDLTGLNAQKVVIYNRYGKEIYSRNNYRNEWEGQTNDGDEVPTGTYFYMIETNNDSHTGWVYVNREEN
ncbi:T9SS type B sorting domain-containing protein [Flavobacterium litorale]|uniref:Gliding motility-associated C-terminal domain-containing protein n=1 Tax=Flavobacterium litorale TaxID=2856519 RepID=A0ABX8V5H6_9FLAO|nr:gliding motility-associated C-terminal domain-containing protein [Flavobacterium litorale]QYJ67742.1 gliding motility-associated C-terminal domain-containing protein [Flavobacterium litorale]